MEYPILELIDCFEPWEFHLQMPPRGKKGQPRGGGGGGGGESHDRRLSKALSWLLRHHIELVFKHFQSEDVEAERQAALTSGFVDVQAVLKSTERLKGFTQQDIEKVVKDNDKQRFSLTQRQSDGAWLIRANQGHTIKGINPDLTPLTEKPSTEIIHGTYRSKLAKILSSGGLSRMARNHIHFSKGLPGAADTTVISGMRPDCDLLFYVDYEKATAGGFEFFESANGVILCSGDEKGILPLDCFARVADRMTGGNLDLQTLQR